MLAEIDVEILEHRDNAMLVTDGDVEGWVLYKLIDPEESSLDEDSEIGETGTIAIPEEKAIELGLV